MKPINTDQDSVHRKRNFTIVEDAALLQLVHQFGIGKWKEIASHIPGRTDRQCRERYKTYLAPGIRNDPWSPEEDDILAQKVKQYGQKWAIISKYLNGRTDNAIKNRYHIHIMHRPHPRKLKAIKENERKAIHEEKNNILQSTLDFDNYFFDPEDGSMFIYE